MQLLFKKLLIHFYKGSISSIIEIECSQILLVVSVVEETKWGNHEQNNHFHINFVGIKVTNMSIKRKSVILNKVRYQVLETNYIVTI